MAPCNKGRDHDVDEEAMGKGRRARKSEDDLGWGEEDISSEDDGGSRRKRGNKFLEAVVQHLLKVSLREMATLRAVTGTLFFTWLLPSKTPLVQAMIENGRACHLSLSELSPEECRQQPAPWFQKYVVLIQQLTAAEEIAVPLRVLLTRYNNQRLSKVEKDQLDVLGEEIRHLKITRAHQNEMSRLVLGIAPREQSMTNLVPEEGEGDLRSEPMPNMGLENLLIKMLNHVKGSQRKIGPPPKSSLERESERLLRKFETH